jgi:uncharacterized protein (DUF4415 family)
MKKVYDFSKGKRCAVVSSTGTTRITIYLDDEILREFKAQSEQTGKGYQTLINDALRTFLSGRDKPLTAETVRKILREELAANQ